MGTQAQRIIKRAADLDERRLEQIKNQKEIIDRLQLLLKDCRDKCSCGAYDTEDDPHT